MTGIYRYVGVEPGSHFDLEHNGSEGFRRISIYSSAIMDTFGYFNGLMLSSDSFLTSKFAVTIEVDVDNKPTMLA